MLCRPTKVAAANCQALSPVSSHCGEGTSAITIPPYRQVREAKCFEMRADWGARIMPPIFLRPTFSIRFSCYVFPCACLTNVHVLITKQASESKIDRQVNLKSLQVQRSKKGRREIWRRPYKSKGEQSMPFVRSKNDATKAETKNLRRD